MHDMPGRTVLDKPQSFEHAGIWAHFYLDARRDPCVEFTTRMGLSLGVFCFNRDAKQSARSALARAVCDALANLN